MGGALLAEMSGSAEACALLQVLYWHLEGASLYLLLILLLWFSAWPPVFLAADGFSLIDLSVCPLMT